MSIKPPLLKAVADSYHRIGKPRSVLLALSGGADSMALLHLLLDLREIHGFELFCVHVNHGLREAAMEEEAYVRTHTADLGIPLQVIRIQVPRDGNLENAARMVRYQACEQARQTAQAAVIALAHHANDQAETLLMHLMRGAGPEGIAGMEEYRMPYWRPLLMQNQKLLLDFLHEQGISYVLDESNLDTRFLRNDLRHKVLTHLEDRAPGLVDRMARAAMLLQDENAFLRQQEDRWLWQNAKLEIPFVFLLREALLQEHPAMQRRLLRRLCQACAISLDYEQTEALRGMLVKTPGSTMNLPGGCSAFLSTQRLHILCDDVKLTKRFWSPPRMESADEGMGDGMRRQVVDAERIQGAVMRQVQPGDVIVPLGMQGSQAIRKYFSARKLDVPFRPYWPVFARGNQVLWVPGCGVSATAAVSQGTKNRVMLVFDGILPHEIPKIGGKEP